MASQCQPSCSGASYSEPDVRRLDYSSESDFSEPEEQVQKGDRVSLQRAPSKSAAERAQIRPAVFQGGESLVY